MVVVADGAGCIRDIVEVNRAMHVGRLARRSIPDVATDPASAPTVARGDERFVG